jgi:tetratricopeptide (TPR) repeat protein
MIPFLIAALVWQTDWNATFAQAKQQHKLVLVDYYKAPCPNCFDIEHFVRDGQPLAHALDDYVLLRVDLSHTAVPLAHRHEPPAYVIFDAGGRERLRIYDDHGRFRADDWHSSETKTVIEHRDSHATRNGSTDETGVIDPLATFRAAAPQFVKAAALFDAKRDLDAHFVVATTYHRLKMTKHARAAFAEAKKVAEREGKPAIAQSAEVQSAYTYVTDGRAAYAVELLKPLSKTPASKEIEPVIWLTLGHAYEAATDKAQAVEAFRRAQSLAVEGTRTRAEAAAALKRLE